MFNALFKKYSGKNKMEKILNFIRWPTIVSLIILASIVIIDFNVTLIKRAVAA